MLFACYLAPFQDELLVKLNKIKMVGGVEIEHVLKKTIQSLNNQSEDVVRKWQKGLPETGWNETINSGK